MNAPDRARRAGSLLRLVTLLVLAILLVLGLEGEEAALEGSLRLPEPIRLSATDVPGESGWRTLAGRAAEAPLTAVVSGRPPPVVLDAPSRLRAGRPAALAVEAHTPVRVTLLPPGGIEEVLDLEPGERKAFLLRPREEGWATWRLETSEPEGTRSISWSGWVEPEAPLRILALSGPPTQESRLAWRALEEGGEEVEAWIHLGRDVWAGRPSGPLPGDREIYEEFDVVILFPGLTLPASAADALLETVREGGLGLLLAGTTSGSDLLAGTVFSTTGIAGWERDIVVGGDTLRWTLPAEVAPLPEREVETRLRTGAGASRGGNLLGLGTLGRGRLGALSLTETWRWRMEAGAMEGHRDFWVSTASWLAGGLVADPAVELLSSDVRTGDAVPFRLVGGDGSAGLRLQDPDGGEGRLELTPSWTSSAGFLRAGTFAPLAPGGYRLVPIGPGGAPLDVGSGVWVRAQDEDVPDPEGRLARLALSSPGGGVEVRGAGEEEAAERAPQRRVPWLPLLFVALAGTLALEWTLRRRGGAA